jgi:uncharacterized protein (TIGR03435 family)
MRRIGNVIGSCREVPMSARATLAIAALIAFLAGSATPGRAQAPSQVQAQNTTGNVPKYEYEVVSIKENKSTGFPNATAGDDGFTVTNIPLQALLFSAFGVGKDRIVDAPDWLSSEKYDVNAKMDPSVSDALKKLSADDKKLAQQQMLIALFADRCKLKFHRETKELQVYTLVIGKNGPKFQESKPDDASDTSTNPANGIKVPDGRGGSGRIRVGAGGAVTFHGLPLTVLVAMLSTQLGRTVVDKTGLAGKYDFTWQFVPDPTQLRAQQEAQPPAGGGANGGGPILPTDPSGSSLFTAVQEQLGLKLESGKGPVEIIVIDHIERPSGN